MFCSGKQSLFRKRLFPPSLLSLALNSAWRDNYWLLQWLKSRGTKKKKPQKKQQWGNEIRSNYFGRRILLSSIIARLRLTLCYPTTDHKLQKQGRSKGRKWCQTPINTQNHTAVHRALPACLYSPCVGSRLSWAAITASPVQGHRASHLCFSHCLLATWSSLTK